MLKLLGAPKEGFGDICIPMFSIAKSLSKPPPQVAEAVKAQLTKHFEAEASSGGERVIDQMVVAGPFLNMFISMDYLAAFLPQVLDGSFLAPMPSAGKKRVMIEYSQPNTHKAFHVGHMRNAALGDCLVRLYEQCGYPVKKDDNKERSEKNARRLSESRLIFWFVAPEPTHRSL